MLRQTDLRVILQPVSLPEDLQPLVVDSWFQVLSVTVDGDTAGAGHVRGGVPSMLGDHWKHTHTQTHDVLMSPYTLSNHEERSFC